MTNEEQTALHNEHAPKVLRLLCQPQAEGQAKMSDTMVIAESVLFGVLLLGLRQGYSPAHMLDTIYAQVQERLNGLPPLFQERGQ
jgi:hypothetical protein